MWRAILFLKVWSFMRVPYVRLFFPTEPTVSVSGLLVEGRIWLTYSSVLKILKLDDKSARALVNSKISNLQRIRSRTEQKEVVVISLMGVYLLFHNAYDRENAKAFLAWLEQTFLPALLNSKVVKIFPEQRRHLLAPSPSEESARASSDFLARMRAFEDRLGGLEYLVKNNYSVFPNKS